MRLRRESGDFEIVFDRRSSSHVNGVRIRKGLSPEDLLGVAVRIRQDGDADMPVGHLYVINQVSYPCVADPATGKLATSFKAYCPEIDLMYDSVTGMIEMV